MSTHNLCFEQKYRKNIRVFYLKIFSFLEVKFSVYLNSRVFVMLFRYPFYLEPWSVYGLLTLMCRQIIVYVEQMPNCWFLLWPWQALNSVLLSLLFLLFITKTFLYNFDPLKPHFYIVKLRFTGVYIIFLISAQKHRLWVLVRTASPRQF